jgi:DNA processing protein
MVDGELLVALNMIPQLGSRRIQDIAGRFENLSQFLKADQEELMEIPGISEKLSERIIKYRANINPDQEAAKAKKIGAKIITLMDEDYPELLKQIYDPPPVLYVLGDISTLKYNAVAIVGTRKATAYGRNVAESFARELALFEINVVSGMARGIDSYAHKGAAEVGGPTTAVLGCGVDIIYPPENMQLARNIMNCGCIISSFPLGQRPLAGNFPARNRIISGLSLGTVVVEAAEKSGSLITADFSLEQGREVFAVPGSIFSPYSRGTHKLIKQGAKLVENVTDILEELCLAGEGDVRPEIKKNENVTDKEKSVLGLIDFQPTHVEELLAKSQKTSHELNSILTRLELKGLIVTLPGGFVMKI